MEFTSVGFLCLALAPIVIASPRRLGLIILACFIPLQAAAAANLPAVGNASIICAHFLTGALVLGLAIRPRVFTGALQYGVSNPAVLLLALFTVYAVCSAFILPRLFEGEVSVYSLERTTRGGIALSPLYPTTGNFTQSVYIAVNFLVFAAAAFAVSRGAGLKHATHAINAMTAVHLIFAVISVFPNLPPLAAALEFIRTANYTIHAHHITAGASRIIGSYPEPSTFGAASVGLFAWNFSRFMQTRGLWHLCASVLLILCIVFSLSTTAYAALVLLVALWGLHSVYYIVRPGLSSDHITALLFIGIVSIGLMMLFFVEPVRLFAIEAYERLFGLKLKSDSGLERGAWNVQSFSNFIDTKGFGVGLGSSRASSLALVLLGNVGVIGTLLYLGFMNRSFFRPWSRPRPDNSGPEQRYSRRVFTAARAAAIAVLLSQLISGTVIDGGLAYMLFAALATAAFASAPEKRRSMVIEPVGASGRVAFPQQPSLTFGAIEPAHHRR